MPARKVRDNGQHCCHAVGCLTLVRKSVLMCDAHWAQVPQEVKRRVMSAWFRLASGFRNANKEHAQACKEAIQSLLP
jgi:hypothetical protein